MVIFYFMHVLIDCCRLHLHNEEKKKRSEKDEGFVHKEEDSFVSQFGFDVATCCGYITQDNSWQDNWVVSTVPLYLINLTGVNGY